MVRSFSFSVQWAFRTAAVTWGGGGVICFFCFRVMGSGFRIQVSGFEWVHRLLEIPYYRD